MEIKVYAGDDRKNDVWKGGAKLANLPLFNDHLLISRSNYDETGPRILHQNYI